MVKMVFWGAGSLSTINIINKEKMKREEAENKSHGAGKIMGLAMCMSHAVSAPVGLIKGQIGNWKIFNSKQNKNTQ